MPIPCDKAKLLSVLEKVIDEQVESLRLKVAPQIADDTKTLMQKIGASFGVPGKGFFYYFSFHVLRNHILATKNMETSEEMAQWEATTEGIAPEHVARAYLAKFGVSLEVCSDDVQGSHTPCHTFYAAVENNLPMLRWLHEVAGKPLDTGNVRPLRPRGLPRSIVHHLSPVIATCHACALTDERSRSLARESDF